MSRPRGGYIGFNRVPAVGAASGVWTLREAEAAKRAGTWPASVLGGVTSGLQLWLDASDASTLYDATSGGSLVAADGGVARWEDKSGNARHLTQSTAGKRPVRKTAVQNSLDVLRFDETASQTMVASGTAAALKFLHSSNSTVFFVVKVGPLSNQNVIRTFFGTGTGATTSANFVLFWDNRQLPQEGYTPNQALLTRVGAVNGAVVNTGQSGVGPISLNTYKLISVVTKPTQATAANRVSARINGGTAVSGNTFTGAVDTTNATNDFFVASSSDDTPYFTGDFCEIIVYDSALSDTDRSSVETYLVAKWGIT